MECSGDSVCATKTSCPYWLGREERYKEGQDDTFITDARTEICNVQRRALCCPVLGDIVPSTSSPITVPPREDLSGVIITGGDKTAVGLSVSVYNPRSQNICQLDNLPGIVRYLHTLCGDLLCGGKVLYHTRSCDTQILI